MKVTIEKYDDNFDRIKIQVVGSMEEALKVTNELWEQGNRDHYIIHIEP